MKNKFWLPLILSLAAGFFFFQIAGAQDPSPTPRPVTDDQVNAVAHQMYCPVCENTPLDVCPTPACAEWRDLIRQQLSQGWTEQQIKDYFVQRFGARVLATPPAQGFNWLAYVIPPLAFLAGAFLLFRAFVSLRMPAASAQASKEQSPETPTNGSISGAEKAKDPYVERLEDELRKL
jgi:cytochrome c-type biogenesis protein CcmH